jgi:enoyl-CoA hydratase
MNTTRIEMKDAIAILRMDKARANAIDGAFVDDMTEAAALLAADDGVRGVLIASAHSRVFCPGLDLVGLVELDRPAMKRFMEKFARMVWSLYGLGKPVVAAIGGHAVAGGCVLALTADYRVLRRGGVNIGLNEVRVGVPLPWGVARLLRASASPHRLSEVALLGRNFADEAALEAGLVQELASRPVPGGATGAGVHTGTSGSDDFEAICLQRLAEFVERDALSLARTKQYLRASALADMQAHEAEHADEWLDSWFSETTRARIRETLAALGKPRS